MSTDPERTWCRHPEVLWRSTARGVVVLVPGATAPSLVTGRAREVWLRLDRPLAASAVTAAATDALRHLCELGLVIDA
jgi:hypothetical protein